MATQEDDGRVPGPQRAKPGLTIKEQEICACMCVYTFIVKLTTPEITPFCPPLSFVFLLTFARFVWLPVVLFV